MRKKKDQDFIGKLFAHRGIWNNQTILENTLHSFRRAIAYGYSIELDVQLTKDNQLVVFHDNRTDRLTNQKHFLQDLSLQEVKELILLNTKEKIPTLQEVLQLVQGKVYLDIEIKSTDRIEKMGKILTQELENYDGKYIVKSFNPKIVHWMKKNYPKMTCGLLIHHDYHNRFYNYLAHSKILLYYCKPDFLAVSKKMIQRKTIQKIRKYCPILIWTIGSKEELLKFENLADGYICNNLPYDQ